MADELDRAIAALSDRSGTWVSRRDAADWLGRVSSRALRGLTANRTDADPDVRMGVERALADAGGGLKDAPDGTGPATIDALVKAVEKPGRRDVTRIGGGYEIDVMLRDGRSQKVRVTKSQAQDGGETAHVSTRCGPAADKAMRWALQANTGLTHCSMALVEDGGKAWFDLVHSIPLAAAAVDEFKACVKEIAFYGDWAESKLSEGDTF
jgi:hypothetical protein